jgi:hypothetical protein
MTQPPVIEPTAATQDLLDEESLAYELAAEAAITATIVQEVTVAAQALTVAYLRLAAGGARLTARNAEKLRTRAVELYSAIVPRMRQRLARWVAGGVELGEDQANRMLEEPVTPAALRDGELLQVITDVDRKARERLDMAVAEARSLPMDQQGHVVRVASRGHQAANQARRDTRWAVNRAINNGATSVSLAAGMSLLWIAERDACLHCLALSGQVAVPGTLFPDVTYADRPLGLPMVPYPPRHPNCRCRVTPWSGAPGRLERDHPQAPSALMREARRSVARGWSDHDSEAARLRAAERLLARGANLPKSVEERARRAVRRGKFT